MAFLPAFFFSVFFTTTPISSRNSLIISPYTFSILICSVLVGYSLSIYSEDSDINCLDMACITVSALGCIDPTPYYSVTYPHSSGGKSSKMVTNSIKCPKSLTSFLMDCITSLNVRVRLLVISWNSYENIDRFWNFLMWCLFCRYKYTIYIMVGVIPTCNPTTRTPS